MSYAPAFTERALADLRRIDFWLQEEVLDEIEGLAVALPAPRGRNFGAAVHDFVRERNGVKFYVFMTYVADPHSQMLRVSEIGTFSRPVP